MNVLLDTSPLNTGHSHRGIGLYTAQLQKALQNLPTIELVSTKYDAKSKHLKLDLVHFPYFDLFFPTLPLFKPAKKAVVTIHDVIPLELHEHYPVGKRGKLNLMRQKLSLRSVDAVITDSIYSKKMILQYLKVPEHIVHVIFLAGNPDIVPVSPANVAHFKDQYQLPDNYVLYVGDINYNKNIPQLIKSLRYLPEDLHLVLAGRNFKDQDIPEWQWIETQIALSDVAKRIHFISNFGDQPDHVLSALYSGAAVYVQPSFSEGFGLPVLEAMQAGCLVVSSDSGSLPEVGGPVAQYCKPSAESIAEKVQEVLDWSQTARHQKIQAGKEWAGKFSWQSTAEQTYQVYESLLTA